MRTFILAAGTLLALGAGVAYADQGDGTLPNTYFTTIPGVVAEAPTQVPGAVAQGSAVGAPAAAFVTESSHGTWLFGPNGNQGANS